MAERRQPGSTGAWLLAGLMSAGPAHALDETPPEPEFLEYLGSWVDGDEDWVGLAEEEAIIDRTDEARAQRDASPGSDATGDNDG